MSPARLELGGGAVLDGRGSWCRSRWSPARATATAGGARNDFLERAWRWASTPIGRRATGFYVGRPRYGVAMGPRGGRCRPSSPRSWPWSRPPWGSASTFRWKATTRWAIGDLLGRSVARAGLHRRHHDCIPLRAGRTPCRRLLGACAAPSRTRSMFAIGDLRLAWGRRADGVLGAPALADEYLVARHRNDVSPDFRLLYRRSAGHARPRAIACGFWDGVQISPATGLVVSESVLDGGGKDRWTLPGFSFRGVLRGVSIKAESWTAVHTSCVRRTTLQRYKSIVAKGKDDIYGLKCMAGVRRRRLPPGARSGGRCALAASPPSREFTDPEALEDTAPS